MGYKRFKYWDLEPADFKIETYKVKETGMKTDNKSGVRVELLPYAIAVSCHSKNSQVKNRDECLNILEVILENYKLKQLHITDRV